MTAQQLHHWHVGDVVHLASDVAFEWPMTVVRRENVETVEVIWLDADGESHSRYWPDAVFVRRKVEGVGFGEGAR